MLCVFISMPPDYYQVLNILLQSFMYSHIQYILLNLQEQISEDLRATLNAFLYRTGEQSRK